MLLFLVLPLIFPVFSGAEDFLGAPVIPQREAIQLTDTRFELKTQLSYDQAVTFYRKALEGLKDIKFREHKDSLFIEDHSNRPWHSITISKLGKNETRVVILEDNWTWIMGTLLLRFIGVFVVLIVISVCMSISGRIISIMLKKMEEKKTEG